MEHCSCLFVIFVSFHITTMLAMKNGPLSGNPTGDFSVGDFKRNPFHYLWVKKITSSMVEDQFDCSFLCVAEPKCYSFNMAVYPDSKGFYLCEMLATDKYRETKKFHANVTFHHYSPSVRYISFILPSSVRSSLEALQINSGSELRDACCSPSNHIFVDDFSAFNHKHQPISQILLRF